MRVDGVVQTSPDEQSSLSTGLLVGALEGLYRAYQKTSIYPPGHPAVPRALNKAYLEFKQALNEGSIAVGVAPDHLIVADAVLTESSGVTRALAILLHDLDIAAVEFQVGLTEEQLRQFVVALGRARRTGCRGADLASLLDERDITRIRVLPIDYRALSFMEGVRDGSSELGADVWENLFNKLIDPTLVPNPEQLAREVNAEIRKNEGVGVGEIRKRLHRMHDNLRRVAPDQRTELRKRLARLVTALNPDLRGDLLRVDPQRPGEALSLMTELADVIPEPDLLDALQELDRVGARVPEQFLTLMNKLVRISTERTSLARGLEDTLNKWGVPGSILSQETPDLRGALEEVFQSRMDVDCNPESYQALLDDLSRSDLHGDQTTLDSRYRDPCDPCDVRMHAAEVAVQVLAKGGGDKHRAGLFGFVETATDDLLSHARFATLRDAAVSARTYSLLNDQSDETRRAAHGFLGEFTEEERIQRILEEACDLPKIPEAALSLLGLGGTNALDKAMDSLQRETRFEVTEILRRFLIESGPERIAELLEVRFNSGWHRVRALFPILRRLELTEATRLLKRMFEHADPRVRQEALEVLCDVDPRAGAAERHLGGGLNDPDEGVVLFAVERLAGRDTPAASELLGAYLQGTLGAIPSVEVAQRVVESLSAAGSRGVQQLCICLESLRWSLRPQRILIGCLVAEALSGHTNVPEVKQSVNRWKWAGGARLLGSLLLRLSGRASRGS